MAKYKVTPNRGINIRSGPGLDYNKIPPYAFVKDTILSTVEDKQENGWVFIENYNGWCSLTYLECVEKHFISKSAEMILTTEMEKAVEDSNNSVSSSPAEINKDVSKPTKSLNSEKAILSGSDAITDDTYLKYVNAFGSPPQFSKFTDPPLYIGGSSSQEYKSCGRVYAETLLSNSTLVSICPCNVKYLPGFNTNEKDSFYKALVANVTDAAVSAKLAPDSTLSGKLYESVPAYSEYMNCFNYLARVTSILDGLGDKNVPGTSIKYKNFDWSYYTTKKQSHAQGGGIFSDLVEAAKESATAAITDDNYIHFFLNQNGTSVSENISTDAGNSAIEDLFNNSELSQLSRNIQFLLGGSIDPDGRMSADIQSVFDSTDSNLFKAFGSMASNYFKGGRIVFPKMINDCSYGKSFDCTATFYSPFANKESVYLRCKLPTLALLCFALPKQIAEDMYSSPFICRVFQKGWFNSDSALLTNLNIKMGGPNDTAWTIDSISTMWEVSFSITPLYNKLMLPSLKHPFLALANNAMLEYLATMCGLDLKANNVETKLQIALQIISGAIVDFPRSITREVVAKPIDRWLSPIVNIMNK